MNFYFYHWNQLSSKSSLQRFHCEIIDHVCYLFCMENEGTSIFKFTFHKETPLTLGVVVIRAHHSNI